MSVQNLARKRVLRKDQTEKERKSRLICDYIKLRHPDIHSEAERVYDLLKQVYPEKKDLRKSNEFEHLSKYGLNMPMKKYYIRKSKQPVVKNSMILTIPLMTKDDMHEIVTGQSETTVEEVVTGQSETTVEEVVIDQSCQLESTVEEVVMEQSTQPQLESLEPPLTDAMMAEIINDLRGDPDIHSFFENIDFELDNCPIW